MKTLILSALLCLSLTGQWTHLFAATQEQVFSRNKSLATSLPNPYYDRFLRYDQTYISSGIINSFAIDTARGLMYAVGSFEMSEPDVSQGVAAWNGRRWIPLGAALNGDVLAAVMHEGELYVGGKFTLDKAEDTLTLARWNHTQWEAIYTGFSGSIHTLLSFDGNLYAGGEFTSAQDSTLRNIARWNGKEWLSDGGKFDAAVLCLGIHDNTVYAGGAFTQLNSEPTGHIAVWTKDTWQPVHTPFSTPVHTLLSFEGELYAGSEFQTPEGEPTTGIAVLGNTIWRDLSDDYRTLYQPEHNMSAVSFTIVPTGLYLQHESFVLAALTVDNVSHLAPLTDWFTILPEDYFSYETHNFPITALTVFKDHLYIGIGEIAGMLFSDFIVQEIFVISVSDDSSVPGLTIQVLETTEGLQLNIIAPISGIAECSICDLSGRVLQHFTTELQTEVPTVKYLSAALSSGRYFLTFRYRDIVHTTGFVID